MVNDWQVEVFDVGDCPPCLREIKLLRWLDRKDRIHFTDITRPGFSPASWGMTMKDFMAEVRGRLPVPLPVSLKLPRSIRPRLS